MVLVPSLTIELNKYFTRLFYICMRTIFFNLSQLCKLFIVMLQWTYLMMSRKTASRQVYLMGCVSPGKTFLDSHSETQNLIFLDALVVLFNFFPLVILCFGFVSDLCKADKLFSLMAVLIGNLVSWFDHSKISVRWMMVIYFLFNER